MKQYISDIIEETNNIISDYINTECKVASGAEIGLDPRAAHRLYVGDDCIIIYTKSAGALNYYGGFEYVDSEFVTKIGEYTIYQTDEESDDCRVRGCIEYYNENRNK